MEFLKLVNNVTTVTNQDAALDVKLITVIYAHLYKAQPQPALPVVMVLLKEVKNVTMVNRQAVQTVMLIQDINASEHNLQSVPN